MELGISTAVAGTQPAAFGARCGAPAGQCSEAGPDGLTDDDRQQVQKLRESDRKVRQHEQAHASAGGPYAGAPSYSYVRGPDGRSYAVSGEVSIDASPVAGNPSATIAKMEVVIRAALAPAETSAQDRRVAAQARAAKAAAQAELAKEKQEEAIGSTGDAGAHRSLVAQYEAAARADNPFALNLVA